MFVPGVSQVFYGGQLHSSGGKAVLARSSSSHAAKDLTTLSSLKLQLKSRELQEQDRKKCVVVSHLSEEELAAARHVVRSNEAL